jgi:hypothetical protein
MQYAGDTFAYNRTGQYESTATFWRNDAGVADYFVSREGIGARTEDAPIDGGMKSRPHPRSDVRARLEAMRFRAFMEARPTAQ